MNNNEEYNKNLRLLVAKLKRSYPHLQFGFNGVADNQGIIEIVKENDRDTEKNKEIIRRLRIQNYKQLKELEKLKTEIKKGKSNRTAALRLVKELIKLIK
jgi:hypothetical protein